jgi:hypothetical protein
MLKKTGSNLFGIWNITQVFYISTNLATACNRIKGKLVRMGQVKPKIAITKSLCQIGFAVGP